MKCMLTALLAMAGSVVATAPVPAAEPRAAKASTQFFVVPVRTVTKNRPAGRAAQRLCEYRDKTFKGQKRPLVVLNDADWRNNHYPNGKSLNDSALSIFNSSGFAI